MLLLCVDDVSSVFGPLLPACASRLLVFAKDWRPLGLQHSDGYPACPLIFLAAFNAMYKFP